MYCFDLKWSNAPSRNPNLVFLWLRFYYKIASLLVDYFLYSMKAILSGLEMFLNHVNIQILSWMRYLKMSIINFVIRMSRHIPNTLRLLNSISNILGHHGVESLFPRLGFSYIHCIQSYLQLIYDIWTVYQSPWFTLSI